MAVKPHAAYSKILSVMKALLPEATRVSAVFYRCVETSFAHEITLGEGARIHGGRWNPLGSFRAVYLSDSPETALQEFLARARRMKWPDHKSLPMVMAAVEVKASRILDLGFPTVNSALQNLLESEKAHWRTIQSRREAVSQAIGRAANEACFQGLIASSQQVPGGKNIIVFPMKLSRLDKLATPRLKAIR